MFPDERGFFCETYRRSAHQALGIRRRLRAGQPLPLIPGRAARHALHGRPRRRQARCAARAGASSTSPSTCAQARPPTGAGRPSSSATSACATLFVPVGFATASACSRRRRRHLQADRLLRPPARTRIASDDPDVGCAGRCQSASSSCQSATPPRAARRGRRRAAVSVGVATRSATRSALSRRLWWQGPNRCLGLR